MAMTMEDAKEHLYRVVGYKPHAMARTEYGVVTAVTNFGGVHVLFMGDRFAKFLQPEQIISVPEAWVRTHIPDMMDHFKDALDPFKAVMAEREDEQA